MAENIKTKFQGKSIQKLTSNLDASIKKHSTKQKQQIKYASKKLTKNIKKSVQNIKKNSQISQIVDDFIAWIYGIQEDEPLKSEAKNIYFIVELSQNDIVLSYSADEKLLGIFDYGAYFPLEAEYFDCSKLKALAKKLFDKQNFSKHDVKKLLFDVVSTGAKSIDFFAGHKIFLGERFSKVCNKNRIM